MLDLLFGCEVLAFASKAGSGKVGIRGGFLKAALSVLMRAGDLNASEFTFFDAAFVLIASKLIKSSFNPQLFIQYDQSRFKIEVSSPFASP